MNAYALVRQEEDVESRSAPASPSDWTARALWHGAASGGCRVPSPGRAQRACVGAADTEGSCRHGVENTRILSSPTPAAAATDEKPCKDVGRPCVGLQSLSFSAAAKPAAERDIGRFAGEAERQPQPPMRGANAGCSKRGVQQAPGRAHTREATAGRAPSSASPPRADRAEVQGSWGSLVGSA